MHVRVWGLGVWGLEFGFGVWGLGVGVCGVGVGVWCLVFWVKVENPQTRPCRAVVNLVVTKVATLSQTNVATLIQTNVVRERSHTTSSAGDRGAGRQSRSCGCFFSALSRDGKQSRERAMLPRGSVISTTE